MPGTDTRNDFRRLLILTAGLLLVMVGIAWTLAPGEPPAGPNEGMTRYFLVRQDLVAVLLVEAAIVFALIVPGGAASRRFGVPTPRMLAIGIALIMLVLCWLGTRLVLGGYDLSRDEQMVSFDAAIFASGRLFAPIPTAWHDLAQALNQLFILPIGDHEAWVSAYLPMNAAIRAIFLRLGDATLAGPCLVALGALALWRIAARLWPDSPASQIVALSLYAGSSQIWVTAMTTYAMTAHLALNLVWLWLFLRNRPTTHAMAILVGFVATGLHQPLFHPLFVLPFLDLLLREKRWRLLAAYGVAYAAIGVFWLAWPLWISAHGVAPPAPTGVSGIGYLERFANAVAGLQWEGIGLMAANLVRFVAWQHLLLLPLAAYGAWRCWNAEPVARALAVGIILPIVVILILIPYQGHGWGYRYLHGVIGNACLLGGYAWRELQRHRAPVTAMAAAMLASLLVSVPLHAAIARHMIAPFAAIAAKRDATSAAIVIIDDEAAPFAQDLVVNRADLSNRPLVLIGRAMDPRQIAGLCQRGSIAFLGATQLSGLSTLLGGPAPILTPSYVALEDAARSARCRVMPWRE